MLLNSTFTFSIVVPTYNRAQNLRNLLESVEKLDIPENIQWEVLVVDNNSTDCTGEVVEAFIKRKRLPLYYFFEKEQGSSHARNRGIREARGQIAAFLDDDDIVDKYWLAALREGFDRFQCAGIGGKVVAKWAFPRPNWYTIEGPFRIVGPTSGHNLGEVHTEYSLGMRLPATANLAIKKDCFQKYGFFRTDMGPVGNDYIMGEDTEFCIRLIREGERLIYSPKAIVYNMVHKERVTKEYCKRYHFLFGRTEAQLYELKEGKRTCANVPHYLFREYLETLLSWLSSAVCFKRQARFYYRLKLSRISGQIFEHVLKKYGPNIRTVSDGSS